MSLTRDFIKGLVFVVLYSVLDLYWPESTDLATTIVKTAGVFFLSAVLTLILVKMIQREKRE